MIIALASIVGKDGKERAEPQKAEQPEQPKLKWNCSEQIMESTRKRDRRCDSQQKQKSEIKRPKHTLKVM